MNFMKYYLIFALIFCSQSSFAKASDISFYDYGGVHLFTSKDQLKLRSIEFYKDNSVTDWSMCTPILTNKLKVTNVKYSLEKEISGFTVNDPKWGEEFYSVDLSEIPQAHKWLLSTLVQKGRIIKITSRACGSSLTPYLIRVEK